MVRSIVDVKTYSLPFNRRHPSAGLRNIGHVKQTRHAHCLLRFAVDGGDVGWRLRLLAMIKALSAPSSVVRHCHYIYPTTWGVAPARPGTGQRRTRCKSIRALRPAPRPRRTRALSVALLFGTGRHTDQLKRVYTLHDRLVRRC